MLEFGICFSADPPPTRMVELGRAAEEAGFDYVWAWDSHVLWQDVYPIFALLAEVTSRIRMGPCVTNPATRDPTVTASTLATLNDISGDRMEMGIGRGDSARRVIGQPPVTIERLEWATRLIKDLAEGRPVDYDGTEIQLKWAKGTLPVWIAAYGPKALRLAGRIGDGVILQLADPHVIQWLLRWAREGAEEAGRNFEDVKVMAAARAGGGRRAPVQHLFDGRRPRGRDPQLRQGADPDARAGPRRAAMTTIRAAIIQANANLPKDEAIDKHVGLIAKAAADGAQITCLQEIFNGPYFPAEQDPKWYATADREDGPTVTRMLELARDHGMALIVPFYEEAQPGVYYNSAVVVERDGSVLGKYRKTHIPQVGPCFWEKYYFKPGNLGYPVFDTSVGRVGLIICYDRHFPEVARQLGLKGAELVFNPSATVESLSRYLWELEQPAHAVANGYWIAAINRVGTEEPLNSNRFYGSSYFCDPRGQIVARASEDSDEVLIADIDLDKAREVRNTWQFLRDRRPETYGELTELLP